MNDIGYETLPYKIRAELGKPLASYSENQKQKEG